MIDKQIITYENKKYYLLGKDNKENLYGLLEPVKHPIDKGYYWQFANVAVFYPFYPKSIKFSHYTTINNFLAEFTNLRHRDKDKWIIKEFVYREKEAWDLSEMFAQYNLLNKMSTFCSFKKPCCNIAEEITVDHGNLSDWNKKINEEMLPKVIERIIEILTPSDEDYI